MELSVATITGIATFFICSSVLVYRNFLSQKRFQKYNQEKINIIVISLVTIILPFLLGRMSLELELSTFLSILSNIASLGIPVTAFLAWKAYSTIIQDKFYEKQLEEIRKLLKQMSRKRIIILAGFIPNSESLKTPIHNWQLITLPNIKLIDLSKKYEIDNFSNGFFENMDYKHMFVSEDFANLIDQITNYGYEPFMPNKTANKIKNFKINERVLSQKYEPKINICLPENKIKIINDNFEIEKVETLESFIILGTEEMQKCLTKADSDSEKKFDEQAKRYIEKCHHISVIYNQFINYSSESFREDDTYYSWTNFRKELNDLMKAIRDWFYENNIKNKDNINLPDLDNTNSHSKKS